MNVISIAQIANQIGQIGVAAVLMPIIIYFSGSDVANARGMKISCETGRVYEMKSTCTVPNPFPKGYRGAIPLFSYDEEGALVLE